MNVTIEHFLANKSDEEVTKFPKSYILNFFFFCISKGANDSSFEIFTRINQLCTKVTRILVVKYVLGYYVLSVTLALVNVTFCYIKEGDGIDTLCLYTPYKHMYSLGILILI